MSRFVTCLRPAFLLTAMCLNTTTVMAEGPGGNIDFNRDVRPILSDKCVLCHGPDSNHREADLRLDVEDEAAAVIAAGSSADSELIRRIVSQDPDEQMPPPDSNRKLTSEEIDVLRRWIDQGATWSEHWSFTPLKSPPVPEIGPLALGRILNPIDAFVHAKLAANGLSPSPAADRRTLIRRVSLDLTGLPPTPEEVTTFLEDPNPQAYQTVVDRLLESPAYGERMAWNWLDAARYADTNGYQGDGERTMWPWRDWVIRAFNDNLPYDEFTVQQLAGDLLPEATFDQKLATGFNRNHMINGEGGRIPEENRVDYVMDMSETMGTVWLGLTLNCCRCHDHKFDPITQREYYQFFAFFNQTPVTGGGGNPQTPPVLAVPSDEQQQRSDQLEQELASLNTQTNERQTELANTQTVWEREYRATHGQGPWTTFRPDVLSAAHQELRPLDDDSILAAGPPADQDTYTLIGNANLLRITGLQLEALRHESLNGGSLSRSGSGNFVLTTIEVRIGDRDTPVDQWKPVAIATAEATFEQAGHPVTNAFDDDPRSGWAVYEGRLVDREHRAVFRFAEPIEIGPETGVSVTLRHESPHSQHNLGRFRLSLTSVDVPGLGAGTADLLAAINTPPQDRSEDQRNRIVAAHRETDELWKDLTARRDKKRKQLDAHRTAVPKVMVMADRPEPRESFLLNRGLYNQPGEPVVANTPAALPPLPPDVSADRLALAQWLVSAENPLTARVTVNRFWQQIFGIGLVKTPEDFGRQGELPPHLELLDWLAANFRDHGWDVKRLIRMIVMSHTYQQASQYQYRDSEVIDPDNRLLGRAPRFRMPFWMLRDQALAASGLLVPKIGGPPVNGYQPAGVWEEATFGNKKYVQQHGEALYRRSLYTFWRRIIAPTMFFDNASRQTCTVKVFRTNTPLQALLTLNDVAFVEAARTLAERAMKANAATDADRLDVVFRRLLARAAEPEEQQILLAGLSRTRQQFAASEDAAAKLLAVGESPRDAELDAVEHASWTAVCLAVFNLDEALTKE